MPELQLDPPLAALAGAVPPAPEWFARNIAAPAERFSVTVDGTAIDCRAWGERGRPGLVFFHGNAAHLAWWSFLLPFFAATHRVVAFSLSGMGESGWREEYSTEHYLHEGLAAAEAGGACLAGPPIIIGHSAGGMPVIGIAARFADRLRAAILVDSGLPGDEMMGAPPRPSGRSYPDIASALARFRLSPQQPCANLYVADFIARQGLQQLDNGEYGWRFDPRLFGSLDFGDPWVDLANAKVPLAIVRGELSELTGGRMDARMRRVVPAGTLFVDIPEAYHHVMIDQPLALAAALRALIEAWA